MRWNLRTEMFMRFFFLLMLVQRAVKKSVECPFNDSCVLSKFRDNLFGVILMCVWGNVAWSYNLMFWVLSETGGKGKQGNYYWSKIDGSYKNENCPLRNTVCYLYAFDGIKKASTVSVCEALWLAKKSLIPPVRQVVLFFWKAYKSYCDLS